MSILEGNDKEESYNKIKKINYLKWFKKNTINEYERLLTKDLKKINVDSIDSSGYVRNTLESVIWVILNTDSFSKAIIGTVNLENDTDTIGAITGSIAGLIYGYESIPKRWLSKLKRLDYLEEISIKFENSFK